MDSTKLCIKKLLRERRWTTKILAEKTGMSESYLTHIKNGTRRWNQDALRKISEAFNTKPVDLFLLGKQDSTKQNCEEHSEINIVPVVGSIPEYPEYMSNRMLQYKTGYQSIFVPIVKNSDSAMFALVMQDVDGTSVFSNGDYLLFSPSHVAKTGDIVAVEYGNLDDRCRAIKKMTYSDNIIVLDSVHCKQAPVVLTRGRDFFRIIGRLLYRYQNL